MDISRVASQAYERIASGSQINRSADNPAGLAISQDLTVGVKASNQAVDNVETMANALQTADGALAGINDNLSRIRELALQASNGIMSTEDQQIIQTEIESLKEGISDIASQSQFNGINLLDGSFSDKQVALNRDGSGPQISLESAGLDALGIASFDVTSGSSITELDEAVSQVSQARANIGSARNAFEHSVNNITSKSMNLSRANSQIQDADIAKEITNLKRDQMIRQYQYQVQQMDMQKQENESQMIQSSFDYQL